MARKIVSRLLPLAPLLPLAGMMLGAGLAAPAAPPQSQKSKMPASATFEHNALPLVQRYCVTCHGGDNPSGGIKLTDDHTLAVMLAHRDLWDRVAANVDNHHMPPDGSPTPTAAERSQFVNYVQSTLSQAACAVKDPGHITVRRLNRTEYDNTVRDLTGLDLHLSDDFPNDDVGYGFDNIGDVLSISPLLMEKYLTAAGKIAHAANRRSRGFEDRAGRPAWHPDRGQPIYGQRRQLQRGQLALRRRGRGGIRFRFPSAGPLPLPNKRLRRSGRHGPCPNGDPSG